MYRQGFVFSHFPLRKNGKLPKATRGFDLSILSQLKLTAPFLRNTKKKKTKAVLCAAYLLLNL